MLTRIFCSRKECWTGGAVLESTINLLSNASIMFADITGQSQCQLQEFDTSGKTHHASADT